MMLIPDFADWSGDILRIGTMEIYMAKKEIYIYNWVCRECGHVFTASSDANGCSQCGSSDITRTT